MSVVWPKEPLRRAPNRFESLDGLRGLAAAAVVLFHVSWSNHFTSADYVRNLYVAVDLFFILSGFVIAASYGDKLRTGQDVQSFLARRFFRVYPLHFVILMCLLALEGLKFISQKHGAFAYQPAFTNNYSLSSFFLNLFFLQGSGLASGTSWNVPSWTVSSEFVAYGLFAAAGFCGLIEQRRLVFAIASCGLIAYLLLALTKNDLNLSFDYGIIRCLAGFSCGAAIDAMRRAGYFNRLQKAPVFVISLIELCAAACLLLVLYTAKGYEIVLSIPVFAALVILLQAGKGALSKMLQLSLFQSIGAISYSIYMLHVPIRNLLMGIMEKIGIPSHQTEAGKIILDIQPLFGDLLLGVFLIILGVAACLSFKYVEEPMRLFGRRPFKHGQKLASANQA